MASYRVEIAPSAHKELKWLAATAVERIYPRLESLATNPRPPGCKKLKGGDREWRVRVGEYRIIYTIDDAKRLVEITRIRHRSEAYEP